MMPTFESEDAKSRKHERQEMSKAIHVSSLVIPGFGSEDAKIMLK